MEIGYSSNHASSYVHAIAYYFIDVDGFFDGGEGDVFAGVFGNQQTYYTDIGIYRNQGYKEWVERTIRNAPSSIREEIGRFGCAICAGRGYISDSEKALIKRL